MTVLIAAADLLPSLRQRMSVAGGELLAFSDADALRAFEVIATKRPHMVALERLFAATPRGDALINRIKADPALLQSEIQVISHETGQARTVAFADGVTEGSAASVTEATAPATMAASSLDLAGTRSSPRFAIVGGVDVLVDGKPVALVDLSLGGAQVISASVLRPNQKVRMTLPDEKAAARFSAAIAWAEFECPPGGPRYRAGIKFLDADPTAVDAFCTRHRSGEPI